jgi:hypothetical protein
MITGWADRINRQIGWKTDRMDRQVGQTAYRKGGKTDSMDKHGTYTKDSQQEQTNILIR